MVYHCQQWLLLRISLQRTMLSQAMKVVNRTSHDGLWLIKPSISISISVYIYIYLYITKWKYTSSFNIASKREVKENIWRHWYCEFTNQVCPMAHFSKTYFFSKDQSKSDAARMNKPLIRNHWELSPALQGWESPTTLGSCSSRITKTLVAVV